MKNVFLAVLLFVAGITTSIAQDRKLNKEQLVRELSYVSTSNSFSSAGNFAALSTANNVLTASVFLLDDEGESIFNFTFKGGVSDGVVGLFDEGDLNTNVTVGAEWRKLIGKYNQADPGAAALRPIRAEKEKLDAMHNKRMLELLLKAQKNNGSQPLSADPMLKKVDSLLMEYSQLELTSDKTDGYNKTRIKLLKALKTSLESGDGTTYDDYLTKLEAFYKEDYDAKKKAIEDKERALTSKYLNLTYFAFGLSATNNAFTRFIGEELPANQLDKTEYTSYSGTISFNIASNVKNVSSSSSYSRANRKYLSVGVQYSLTSNLASLTQVEVIDTPFSDESNNRRVEQTQKAFTGDFVEDINQLTAFIDYYSFLDKDKDAVALHLNPEMVFNELLKPVSSFQFGVLIPFKDKEKKKSVVNLEVFYKIKDIFNTTENTNALLNRNIIGLQTSFPFNF